MKRHRLILQRFQLCCRATTTCREAVCSSRGILTSSSQRGCSRLESVLLRRDKGVHIPLNRGQSSSVRYKARGPVLVGCASAFVAGLGYYLFSPNQGKGLVHVAHAEQKNVSRPNQPGTAHSHPPHPHPQNTGKLELAVDAPLTFAPNVPPPIDRKTPALVKVAMNVEVKDLPIDSGHKYEAWTFNGHLPGPFIRAREGDTLQVTLYNGDLSGMPHNLDFHCVSGPGGGAPLLTVESGETKTAWFKLFYPGLFIYHCAVEPLGAHIGNGMYGLILVEPKEGLPKVDREYYVLQSEFYTMKALDESTLDKLELDYEKGLSEAPTHVVLNGKVGAHTDAGVPLEAKTNESVRLFVGNIGPNLVSSFHVIGVIMDKVYREGDLISPPARGVQTTLIPAGGAAVIEFTPKVPGVYTLLDHSIFRVDKGCVAFLKVDGEPAPEIYTGDQPPKVCPGCKIHPGPSKEK